MMQGNLPSIKVSEGEGGGDRGWKEAAKWQANLAGRLRDAAQEAMVI